MIKNALKEEKFSVPDAKIVELNFLNDCKRGFD